MTATFNGVTLVNHAPLKPNINGVYSFEVDIECVTNDHADIDAINALAGYCKKTTTNLGYTSVQTFGTKGTLVLDGTSYTNCAIENGVQEEEIAGTGKTWFRYSMKFVRDTAT